MLTDTKALLSPRWPQAAKLKPRLRTHVDIHRHVFRDNVWYVLQDHVSGRFQRFSPSAYAMIGRMNGEHTLDEIWSLTQHEFPEDAPTQEEAIDILAKLYMADAIVSDKPADIEELSERGRQFRQRQSLARIKSPLAVRFPLFDPDQFLTKTLPLVRPLLGWPGRVLWIVAVLVGAVLAATNSGALLNNLSDRVLSSDNLIVLAGAYTIMKLFHELGHAYTVKHRGGEVHEIGIMLLVFFPVPYVDASASTAFLNRWHRAAVGAAGIAMELFMAAVAVMIWVSAEEGLLRALAFNAALIGGVSTLFFNGNPLLRFDGYYVFADAIESPNLGPRSNQYLLHLIGTHVFKAKGLHRPIITGGERWQLPLYGIASLIYRVFIMIAIISFVATKFFFIGVLIAAWSIFMFAVLPLIRAVRFLFKGRALAGNRGQALCRAGLTLGTVVVLLLVVPVPWATMTEGVVWIQKESIVRSRVAGFVEKMPVAPRETVAKGDVLVELSSPILEAQFAVYEAQLAEARSRKAAVDTSDPVAALALQRQIDHLTEQVSHAGAQVGDKQITAPADGLFLAKGVNNIEGRFFNRGALVGYIFDPDEPVVIVVVRKEHIDLLRSKTRKVSVRLSSARGNVYQASVNLISPASTTDLPTPALSTIGGGSISLDPRSGDRIHALEDLFIVELKLPPLPNLGRIGERVHVRFDHGWMPIGMQVVRRVRQVFLEKFSV